MFYLIYNIYQLLSTLLKWELNHQYYGPIDDPHLLASKKDPEDFEYLNVYAVAAGRSVADVHLHTKLMETNKVPFNLENSRPDLKSAKAGIKT